MACYLQLTVSNESIQHDNQNPQNTYAFIRTSSKYNFLQQSADNEMSIKAIEDVRIVYPGSSTYRFHTIYANTQYNVFYISLIKDLNEIALQIHRVQNLART